MVRSGLHCAPAAHCTLGTFSTGTVRFSFGWFNTLVEVEIAIEALHDIAAWAARAPAASDAGWVKTWTG